MKRISSNRPLTPGEVPWVTHASEAFARQYIPGMDAVCISITGPGGHPALSNNFDEVLRLEFDDVIKPPLGHPIDESDADKIAKFIIANRGKSFFIHCAAGISRSSAVAVVILEFFPEYEDKGWEFTGHSQIVRCPNVLVKRLLKRALRGQMELTAGSGDWAIGKDRRSCESQ